MVNAGVCCYDGMGVSRNPQIAARYFLGALEAGNLRVLNALAYMYATGDGIPRHPDKAFEYARSAVRNGLPHSMPTLASR